MNITRPTVIQRKGIPHMIEGRDVLIRSKTGTGKTLTYLLPIVQHLQAPVTLVLTNEPSHRKHSLKQSFMMAPYDMHGLPPIAMAKLI